MNAITKPFEFDVNDSNYTRFLADTNESARTVRERYHALLMFGLRWYAGEELSKDGKRVECGDAGRLTEIVNSMKELKVAGHKKAIDWVTTHSALGWSKNQKTGVERFGKRKNETSGQVNYPENEDDRYWNAGTPPGPSKALDVIAVLDKLNATLDKIADPEDEKEVMLMTAVDNTALEQSLALLRSNIMAAFNAQTLRLDPEAQARELEKMKAIERDNRIEDSVNNYADMLRENFGGDMSVNKILDIDWAMFSETQRAYLREVEREAKEGPKTELPKPKPKPIRAKPTHVGKQSRVARATDPAHIH